MQRVVYEDFTKILFTSPHGNGIPAVLYSSNSGEALQHSRLCHGTGNGIIPGISIYIYHNELDIDIYYMTYRCR